MRRLLIVLAVALVVAMASVGILWLRVDPIESVVTSTPFRYGFELRNDSSEVIQDATLTVFAPADIVGRQRLVTIDANAEYQLTMDELGNRKLTFAFDVLPPYGSKVLVIDGEVEILSPAEHTELVHEEQFLAAEANVQVEDGRIVAKAREIAASGDIPAVALAFVHRHVQNVGYLKEDRGALYALTRAQGDCTEFMTLYSALLRANGIPVRNLAGFLVNPQGARLDWSAYHNWTEYYDGRRWILVDPQLGLMDEGQSRYLTFAVLTPKTQMSGTQTFFGSDMRLSVKFL